MAVALWMVFSGLIALGWVYSSRLKNGGLSARYSPSVFDLVVTAVEDGRVRLEAGPDAGAPVAFESDLAACGLAWPGGYARLGPVCDSGEGWVTRLFTLSDGELNPGTAVRLDTFTFSADPLRSLGLPFEDVIVEGPIGPLPAWLVPGGGAGDVAANGWAILVHGVGTSRNEVLRQLPAVHAAGLNALLVTYRNDEGCPREFDGNYHFGATEWEDLESAVRYALDRGAGRIVLVGQSMGGAIALSFLYRSVLAGTVACAVLDAPLLHFDRTVRARAPRVPHPVIEAGKWVSSWRLGLDWAELDYLRDAAQLTTPILLFHGEADTRVPFATSRELAESRPDLVTFVPTPNVGHVRSWNADPAGYEANVLAFLRACGVVPAAPSTSG